MVDEGNLAPPGTPITYWGLVRIMGIEYVEII